MISFVLKNIFFCSRFPGSYVYFLSNFFCTNPDVHTHAVKIIIYVKNKLRSLFFILLQSVLLVGRVLSHLVLLLERMEVLTSAAAAAVLL